MEVLSRILLEAEEEGVIHGVKVARNAPSISHLSFADDSLLFCYSKLNEGREVKDILDDYCLLSGQSINYNKFAAYFNKGTCPRRCKALARIFNVRLMNEDDRYLGYPIFIKRNKYRSFEAFLAKLRNKINSQQAPLLSQAGRNT